MIERELLWQLSAVSRRYRRLMLWIGLSACWLALAAACLTLLAWSRSERYVIPGFVLVLLVAVPLGLIFLLRLALRRVNDPLWIARRLERRHPDLDSRLLAALEQGHATHPNAVPPGRPLGFLQSAVIEESLAHARQHRWSDLVPAGRLRLAGVAHALSLFLMLVAFGLVLADLLKQPARGDFWGGPRAAVADAFDIKIEPQDTDVERGTSLVVLARFGQKLPGRVELVVADAAGQSPQALPMNKSLDDPLFAGRLANVQNGLTYAVRYAGQQSRWFKVGVFEHPELEQADAKLDFPSYTALPPKTIEDVRSVTAVEGTQASLSLRLNKPVRQATLVPVASRRAAAVEKESANSTDPATRPAPQPVPLTPDSTDPLRYKASVHMDQSTVYRLELLDDAGRGSKQPAELSLNVTRNRVPDLALEFPAKDIDVSPLEEMTVRAKVWDDFGVKRVGMTYSIAGQPPQDVVLSQNVAAKDRREISHTVAMEKLSAEPDQLLSYYLWVEDNAADGSIRRTNGDMFFAEVRPFEEIFRQGEQSNSEEQQNQQSGQNAQQAEEVAEAQKEIIAATWKVVRRETYKSPTGQFVPDVRLIEQSQKDVKENAAALDEKLTDPRSKKYLQNVLKFMTQAGDGLKSAADGNAVDRLPAAQSAEQAAYQELLKLRAREHEVTRSNRQRGQQSASSSKSRRQRQLDQLKLEDNQNRYEQQRLAQQQDKQQAEQRETRQVLSRLRELAQRQEELNRQMKELQSALAEAKDEQKKEELKQQLARLRDQQRQMLRDTDELRDRMEQPENQERMADARQQLDQTRDDVRKAAESLEQGQTQLASAAGARASEKLTEMKEEFRRAAAGQFGESVEQIRQSARDLDQKQKSLADQLAQLNGKEPAAAKTAGERPARSDGKQPPDATTSAQAKGAEKGSETGQQADAKEPAGPRSLRSGAAGDADRTQVAKDLLQQGQNLEQLLEKMRKTIEDAETAEPLLSKQLYDAVRTTRQERTDEAIDATRQLVDRGLMNEAQQAGSEAGKSVSKLREGVEKAAKGVLGDETESLKRARSELDALAQELDREMGRAGQPGLNEKPGDKGQPQVGGGPARISPPGGPATRPGGLADARQQSDPGRAGSEKARARTGGPGTRPADEQLARGASNKSKDGQGQSSAREPGKGEQPSSAQGESPGESPLAAAGSPGSGSEGSPEGSDPRQQQASAGKGSGKSGEGGQGAPPGQRGGGQPGGSSDESGPAGGEQLAQAGESTPGDRSSPSQGSPADSSPGRAGAAARDGKRSTPGLRAGGNTDGGGRLNQGNPNGRGGTGNVGPIDNLPAAGPFTGENFRQWSDRLRDVEEMVGDPELRAQAARIRDQAKAAKAETDRHSKQPNWDVVRTTIGEPMVELRNAITEELMRREGDAALVPLDREPVPPEYAEQVKRYYERLGSGR